MVRVTARSLARALPALLLLLLLAGPSSADPEAVDSDRVDAASAERAKQARKQFESEDFEGAAATHLEAIRALTAVIDVEEAKHGDAIFALQKKMEVSSEDLVAELRGMLVRHTELSELIALHEAGLARCYAKLGRTEEACRAVGRALGHDLGLVERILADEHLASIRSHFAWRDLLLRLREGRAHLDPGDAVMYEAFDRAHRVRLRMEPGHGRLYRLNDLTVHIYNLAIGRHDRPTPHVLTLSTYARLVRHALLHPMTRGGWPYRHSNLFHAGPEIEALQAECAKRFEERREARDGPFWAYLAMFPSVNLGKLQFVDALLDYLRERSPLFLEKSVEGLKWTLENYLEFEQPLFRSTRADMRRLLERAVGEYEENLVPITVLQAWEGHPLGMNEFGIFHSQGLHGYPKDEARAVRWYRCAHGRGFTTATLNLSHALMLGRGVEQDEPAGFELCLQAAEEGNAGAQNLVGWYYRTGRGCFVDLVQARAWFEKAAENKNALGCENLALLHHRGVGVIPDKKTAEHWYRKAIEAGHERGHRRLGNLLFDARRSEADLDAAVPILLRALEKVGDDKLALIYAWSSLQLLGKADEAQLLVRFLRHLRRDDPERGLVRAMGETRIDADRLLREAGTLADEDTRKLVTAHIHFVAGVQALVTGQHDEARRHFEQGMALHLVADSIFYTTRGELERLGG